MGVSATDAVIGEGTYITVRLEYGLASTAHMPPDEVTHVGDLTRCCSSFSSLFRYLISGITRRPRLRTL